MVNRALRGSAAATLLASSLLKATKAVMYTEPTANAQFARNAQTVNAFVTVDSVISTRSRRGSTSVVTDPSPELWVNLLVPPAS